jgi:hypothetical protein
MATHRKPASSADSARQTGLAWWFYRAGDTFAQLIALVGFFLIIGPMAVIFLYFAAFAAFVAADRYLCGGPCF